MPDTPLPETQLPDAPTQLERPRIAAALQHAKASLVVKPPANAFDVAQGALLPLLSALGVDVFDLRQLRLAADASAERVEYRLLNDPELRFVVVAAESALPAAASGTVGCNGRLWRIGDSEGGELELFDEALPRELNRLLNGEAAGEATGSGRRDGEGHDTGEKSPPGEQRPREFVPAGPFERISLAEVRGYAEAVRNMRGKLQVWFDGEQVDITSRSAFYFVLAELAVRHGREDAIPGEDLIVPPEEPPAGRRARPLAKPGWQLLVDHESAEVEERTLSLLEALGLLRKFSATQRGQPYPQRPEQ